MRRGRVFYNDIPTGIITETDDGEYTFRYDDQFVINYPGKFITMTMPVAEKVYTDKRLFSFFDGLIPEGWLLDIAVENWKINRNDRMGLLLACCRSCIGAVHVEPMSDADEK